MPLHWRRAAGSSFDTRVGFRLRFNDLGHHSSLEMLFIIAKLVSFVEDFFEVIFLLLMLLRISTMIAFKHFLVGVPVVRHVAK